MIFIKEVTSNIVYMMYLFDIFFSKSLCSWCVSCIVIQFIFFSSFNNFSSYNLILRRNLPFPFWGGMPYYNSKFWHDRHLPGRFFGYVCSTLSKASNISTMSIICVFYHLIAFVKEAINFSAKWNQRKTALHRLFASSDVRRLTVLDHCL